VPAGSAERVSYGALVVDDEDLHAFHCALSA
jgi:hypothetical protein